MDTVKAGKLLTKILGGYRGRGNSPLYSQNDPRDPHVNKNAVDQNSVYRNGEYVGNEQFYAFCISRLNGPFHFKLRLKPSNQPDKLDEVQVWRLEEKLRDLNAQNLVTQPVPNKQGMDIRDIIFTFNTRKEA